MRADDYSASEDLGFCTVDDLQAPKQCSYPSFLKWEKQIALKKERARFISSNRRMCNVSMSAAVGPAVGLRPPHHFQIPF